MSVLIRPAQLSDARAIGMVHLDTWHSTYTPLVPEASSISSTTPSASGLGRRA